MLYLMLFNGHIMDLFLHLKKTDEFYFQTMERDLDTILLANILLYLAGLNGARYVDL